MKLHDIVEAYIDYKHSLGCAFDLKLPYSGRLTGQWETSPSRRSSLNPSSPLSLELARSPLAGSKTTECLEASTVMLSAADLRRYLRSRRTLRDPRYDIYLKKNKNYLSNDVVIKGSIKWLSAVLCG